MSDDDRRFKVVKVNSHDEVIARAVNLLIGRAAIRDSARIESERPHRLPRWCANYCSQRAGVERRLLRSAFDRFPTGVRDAIALDVDCLTAGSHGLARDCCEFG
jgi:hypothetical protein